MLRNKDDYDSPCLKEFTFRITKVPKKKGEGEYRYFCGGTYHTHMGAKNKKSSIVIKVVPQINKEDHTRFTEEVVFELSLDKGEFLNL